MTGLKAGEKSFPDCKAGRQALSPQSSLLCSKVLLGFHMLLLSLPMPSLLLGSWFFSHPVVPTAELSGYSWCCLKHAGPISASSLGATAHRAPPSAIITLPHLKSNFNFQKAFQPSSYTTFSLPARASKSPLQGSLTVYQKMQETKASDLLKIILQFHRQESQELSHGLTLIFHLSMQCQLQH